MDMLGRLKHSLESSGLAVRGGFHFDEDGVTKTLYLIGHGGSGFWESFSKSDYLNLDKDPLDNWTKNVVGAIAITLNAKPFYPSDGPPYQPFQQWAKASEGLEASPLGMLVHPEFGLWHAYRAALVFDGAEDIEPRLAITDICTSCIDQPCLSSCPVGAFSIIDGYDVPACVDHLKSEEDNGCMAKGCQARRSWPIGQSYRYDPDHAAFHMKAFRASH